MLLVHLRPIHPPSPGNPPSWETTTTSKPNESSPKNPSLAPSGPSSAAPATSASSPNPPPRAPRPKRPSTNPRCDSTASPPEITTRSTRRFPSCTACPSKSTPCRPRGIRGAIPTLSTSTSSSDSVVWRMPTRRARSSNRRTATRCSASILARCPSASFPGIIGTRSKCNFWSRTRSRPGRISWWRFDFTFRRTPMPIRPIRMPPRVPRCSNRTLCKLPASRRRPDRLLPSLMRTRVPSSRRVDGILLSFMIPS
mmetsp:Transcript_16768/g.28855  ORF Transcript_16768/g.28855 Transcript_16768/m.28855 type:complete len:254 (+) Transcript_16768:395-1156(+)